MEIRKYQIGGLTYKPIYRPEYKTPQESSGSSEQDDINLLSLAGSGLQNDFNAVANLYYLAKTKGTDILTGQVSARYLVELAKAAHAMKNNWENYKTAVTHIETEDSGHDVAITTSGWMYALTEKDEITTISPDEYYANQDKYRLLTNADMLEIRNVYPGKAFDTSIIESLNSSFSMKSVTEELLDIISKFGQYTDKMKTDGYSDAEIAGIEEGIRYIKTSEGVSRSFEGYSRDAAPDTLFHIEQAVNYLWSQLPPGMKRTFRAHVAAEGYNPSDPETMYNLLGAMLMEHTSHTTSYDSGLSGGGGRGGGRGYGGYDGILGDKEISLMSEYFGNYSKPVSVPLSGRESNQYLSVPGYSVSILKGDGKLMDGSVTQETAADRYRINRNLGLINTQAQAYFGSNPISLDQMKDIGLDLDKGSYVVYLPQTREGQINWRLIEEVNNLLKATYADPRFSQLSPEQKSRVLKSLVDDPAYDLQGVIYNERTGAIEYTNTKAYVTYYGLTSSANDNIGRDTAKQWLKSQYVVSPNDDYAERFDENWNNNKDLPELDFQSDGFDHVVQGLIILPVSEDPTKSMIVEGRLKDSTYSAPYYGAWNQYNAGSSLYNSGLGITTLPEDIPHTFGELN